MVMVPPTAASLAMRSPVPAAVIASGSGHRVPGLGDLRGIGGVNPGEPRAVALEGGGLDRPYYLQRLGRRGRPSRPGHRQDAQPLGRRGPPGEKPDVALLVQLQQVAGTVEHQLMRVVEERICP